MIVLGITGGVGSGKSEILGYLKEKYNSRIIMTDDYAKEIQLKGGPLFGPVCDLLARHGGDEILTPEGEIDRTVMASMIFSDPELLAEVNALIHPAVSAYVEQEVFREREKGETEFMLLESALLGELSAHYRALMDELWYIYCDEEERRRRLSSSRGYSQEKITRIMESQFSEEEFRRGCDVVIDNSGQVEQAFRQVDREIRRLRGMRDESGE